jgi:hypothetical protein
MRTIALLFISIYIWSVKKYIYFVLFIKGIIIILV